MARCNLFVTLTGIGERWTLRGELTHSNTVKRSSINDCWDTFQALNEQIRHWLFTIQYSLFTIHQFIWFRIETIFFFNFVIAKSWNDAFARSEHVSMCKMYEHSSMIPWVRSNHFPIQCSLNVHLHHLQNAQCTHCSLPAFEYKYKLCI